MSVSNPFSINGSWKIDPDGRQDRSSGLCTTRKMTEDEKIKYGIAVESEDDVEMAHMTKDIVRKMASEGMNTAEIAEHFMPAYPNMRKSLMLAKISMLLSDKKPGIAKQTIIYDEVTTEKTPDEISAMNSHEDHPDELLSEQEETSIKEAAEQAQKEVSRVANESADRIRQAVDEMMELVPDDKINHPSHYISGNIEVIDYLQEKMTADMFEGFCIGNALKYLSRYRHKGGLEDLKRAEWYLNKIITVMETA